MSATNESAPFSVDAGRVGVLLCHGFTSTPQSLRAWADAAAAAGHSVRLPLLPGHGTTWQEMNQTGWPDWLAAVESSLLELRRITDRVVVAGLSMGGTLALRLAQLHPETVDGLVLVNAAVLSEDARLKFLPVLKYLGSLPGIGSDIKKPGPVEIAYDRTPLHALASLTEFWRIVRADLPKVTQPVLIARSVEDHVVPASSTAAILAEISSTEVTEMLLENSFHVATLDNDAPALFDASLAFVDRLTSTGSTP